MARVTNMRAPVLPRLDSGTSGIMSWFSRLGSQQPIRYSPPSIQDEDHAVVRALSKPKLLLCFPPPHERLVAVALDSLVQFAQIFEVFDALAQFNEFAAQRFQGKLRLCFSFCRSFKHVTHTLLSCPLLHTPESGKKRDRKSTRLNSSHGYISYAVFCL